MKKIIAVTAGLIMTAALNGAAFAGQWKQDAGGWWYQNDDGSYPAGAWQWIDSNGDGVAECYYFYSDGYMAYNNDVDGYHLNNDGQWETAGKVQQKSTATSETGYSSAEKGYADIYKQYTSQYGETKYTTERQAYGVHEHLDGINFLGLYDLDMNGTEELLIGYSTKHHYDEYDYTADVYTLDIYTNNGSGAVLCGRIDSAEMWSGGEQSCGIRLMSDGGKLYVTTGSEGTGAGSIYKFYTINNGAVVQAHTFEFDETGIRIDGQKSDRSYKSIWSGWNKVAHYDFDGYIYSGYVDPEYTMMQTRELIEKTKTKLGV